MTDPTLHSHVNERPRLQCSFLAKTWSWNVAKGVGHWGFTCMDTSQTLTAIWWEACLTFRNYAPIPNTSQYSLYTNICNMSIYKYVYIITAGYLEYYGIGNLTIFRAFKNWEKNNIHRIFKKIHRIYFSNSGRYFLGKTNSAITWCKKHSPKPKSCQKLKKSMFQYFFN